MIIDINNYLSWGEFVKQPHVAKLNINEQMKQYSYYSQQYNMLRLQWLAENSRIIGQSTTTTSAAASAGGGGGSTPTPPTPPTINASFVAFGSRGSFDLLAGYSDVDSLNTWYTASFVGNPTTFTLANSKFATGSGIATDGSVWVAVGTRSGSVGYSILNSTNGEGWQSVDQSGVIGSAIYRDVAYGYRSNVGGVGMFVAVGSGSIATSLDGVNWDYDNTRYSGLRAVYNGKTNILGSPQNFWIAVGDNNGGKYGYATNNATSGSSPGWVDFSIGTTDPAALHAVAFSDFNGVPGTWLLGAQPSVGNKYIYKSTDGGATWTDPVNGDNNFTTACYALAFSRFGGGNNGLWVAGGDGSPLLWSDDDGENWTSAGVTDLDVCYSIAWDGTYFVAVGEKAGQDSVALYSTDGMSWTKSTTTTDMWLNGYAVASAAGPDMYPAR